MPEDKPTTEAEKKKACKRAWYLAHQESECAKSRQWAKEHPKENAARSLQRYYRRTATPEYQAERAKRLADRAARLAQSKIVTAEKDKARRKVRYWADRENAIAKSRQWELDHPEETRARKKRWAIAHPGYQNNKRASKMRDAEGAFTPEDIALLRKSQRGRCASCRAPLKLGYHVDHVMPLSRGGTNWPDNLQLLCPKCNRRKSAKLPEQWANELGRLFV